MPKSKKVCIIGPPGSGKTTLCLDISSSLKKRHFNVEMVDESVRRDIHQNGPPDNASEQFRIRVGQVEQEDAVPKNVDYLVIDSGSIPPYFYGVVYNKHNDPRQRLFLADLYKYMLNDIYKKRYDFIFFVSSLQTHNLNKNILNDGTRFQDEDDIKKLETLMEMFLIDFHNPGNHFKLDSPLEERVSFVLNKIL